MAEPLVPDAITAPLNNLRAAVALMTAELAPDSPALALAYKALETLEGTTPAYISIVTALRLAIAPRETEGDRPMPPAPMSRQVRLRMMARSRRKAGW